MPPEKAARLTIIIGVVLGVLVTISSVGAGALGVTALLMLYPRVPMARIVGSDIAHAVPLTLVAGVGHWWLGSVDWPLLTSLLSGSIPGIVLGSYLSAHIPDAVLRPILAVTLMLVGGRLVYLNPAIQFEFPDRAPAGYALSATPNVGGREAARMKAGLRVSCISALRKRIWLLLIR